jgi:hypothetical protein
VGHAQLSATAACPTAPWDARSPWAAANDNELAKARAERPPSDAQSWSDEGVTDRHVTERNAHRIVVGDLGDRIDIMISTPDGDAKASLDSAFINASVARCGAVDHLDRLDDARLRAETPEKELGDLALRQMVNGQDPDAIEPPF